MAGCLSQRALGGPEVTFPEKYSWSEVTKVAKTESEAVSLCPMLWCWGCCRRVPPQVPAGWPSRGGDVTDHVWHKSTELAHSFLFCSCVYFCSYGPFNCISFHKFSQQFLAFSLCSPDLISALLVLSTVYIFINISLNGLMTCVLGKKYRRWIEHCF